MLEVPVYLITGFLESGKTTFIKEVLDSPDFADGRKTLLIQCEEGEVEYDEVAYSRHNIEIISVENEEDLTPSFLDRCHKFYKPFRVFVEFNGMWDAKKFAEEKLPSRWELVQVITLVDGSTYEVYLNNMRSILQNIFSLTELVIMNRCSEDMDLFKFRRSIKGVNPQVLISFEDDRGNQIELGKEQPPYDLNADIVEIADRDYAEWERDISEEPDKYEGKILRLHGFVVKSRDKRPGHFGFGRQVMTCCEADIAFLGFPAVCLPESQPVSGSWIELTARVDLQRKGEDVLPVLMALTCDKAEKPENTLATFY